jgi:hypothetical protein
MKNVQIFRKQIISEVLKDSHIFMDKELSSLIYHCIISWSVMLFHKPEKFWDKIRAKTYLGEIIGCESTGPQMWKYWSPDLEVLVLGCVKLCLEMLPEFFGHF